MEEKIKQSIIKAIQQLQQSGEWRSLEIPKIEIEIPVDGKYGDFSSNIAMRLAPILQKEPIDIAARIAEQIFLSGVVGPEANFQKVNATYPGFLNFFLASACLAETVQQILRKGASFGRTNAGKRRKVLIEFISANPTGPLTLPNARGGFLGDTLANVYEFAGYNVTREYYVNDRGRQIEILGESVARRYLQTQGVNVPFPEELYQGGYIADLVKKIEWKDYKLTNSKKLEWVKERITKQALDLMLKDIQRVVKEKMKITFDDWFSEKKLYEDGYVDKAYKLLKKNGYVYEKEGAAWLATLKFGDEKDRVIIKSNGEGSYLHGDAALFYERAFKRKFNEVILIIGADHHGFEKRMKALPKMFNSETALDLIFIQLVTLTRQGKEVRMSKRAGNFVTIDDLIAEIGHDVARFFFLMSSADRHMNFDLDLAKEQSEKNPVFYVQYAHARICSILREAEKYLPPQKGQIVVAHDAERALVKLLLVFPGLIASIVANYEVHHLTHYALDLARAFHHFYDNCRVIDNGKVDLARYSIIRAAQIVLANTLALMGITAPEKM